jgi:hypothetical protein
LEGIIKTKRVVYLRGIGGTKLPDCSYGGFNFFDLKQEKSGKKRCKEEMV